MVVIAALLVGVAHTPFVRARVLSWLVTRLRTDAGLRADVDRLDYNLLTLSATLNNVTIAAEGKDIPFLRADAIHVNLPWSVVRGRVRVQSLDITRPRLAVVRRATGALNLPGTGGAPRDGARSGAIGPIEIGRLVVRDLELSYTDPSQDLSVDGRGITLDLARATGAVLRGDLSMSDRVTIRAGRGRQTTISELRGRLAFDGTALAFEELALQSSEAQVRFDGKVDLLSSEPRAEVQYTGGVDLGRLAPWLAVRPAPSGRVAFSGRIDGPLGQPSATVHVSGDQLAWSTLTNMSIAADGVVSPTEGTVESFWATLAGGEVTGEARLPLGPSGLARARVRWRGLDVGTLAGAVAADLPVHLAFVTDGTATLDWTGQEVISARGSVESWLRAPSARRDGLTVDGHAELRLNARDWRLSVDQRIGEAIVLRGLAGGRLDASDFGASTVQGDASLQVADVHDALQRLGAAGIQVKAEDLQALQASVDAKVALAGTFRSPRGTGTLEASNLRYNEIGPGSARASFAATASRLTVDPMRIELGPNIADAHAVVDIDAHTLAGALTADLSQVALLATILPSEWRPEGSARVEARVTGALDNPTVDATVSSDDLRLAGHSAVQLRATARLEDRFMTIGQFELAQDEGRLSTTGHYAIAGRRYDFEAVGSDLAIAPVVRGRQTPPSATLSEPDAEVIPIDARFDLRFSGAGTLASPEARGFVRFTRLAWGRYQLGTARVDAVVEHGAARLTVGLPELPASVEAVIGLDAPHSFTATALLRDAKLSQLTGPSGPAATSAPEAERPSTSTTVAGALALRAQVTGQLDDLAAASADVDARFVDVAVNGTSIRLDRPARLRYGKGSIVADDVEIHIGGTTLSASGQLGGPASGAEGLRVKLAGSLADLGPIARLAPGFADVHATGSIDVQARVAGALDAPEIDGSFSLDSGSFTVGALPPVSDVALHASYAQGLFDLRDMRATWQGATVTGSGQLPATILGDRLPETYRNTLPDLPDRAHATVRIGSITQTLLSPFVDLEAMGEVAGRFDAVAVVEAGSVALKDVTADVTFERAELELGRVPLGQARPTRFLLADNRLEVVEWSWTGGGNRFNVAGNALLSGEAPMLDVAVAGSLDLRMLGAFSRDVVTGGIATLEVKMTGSAHDPLITGQAAFKGGSLIVRDPRLAVSDIQGVVDMTRDRLQLRDITGNANGGTLRIAGDVQYQDFTLTGGMISLAGRGLAFEIPRGLRTEVDTDLQLALAQTMPSLNGRVTILRGSYRSPISLTGQLLSGVEVRSAAPQDEAEPGLASRLLLGLTVVSAENIVVDNNYGRLEIGSNLRVVGTLGRPVLAGRLTFQEGGEVLLGGRTYRVRRGTVDFTNATRTEPHIDLALETRVQRYDITMQVSGTPDTIEASLTSPGVSQADVVSLLLTGQMADSVSVVQTEVARSQLLMLLSGELLGFAGRAVGLNTLQVGRGLGGAASDFDLLVTDTDPSARLTIGKNLGRNVEVVFSQSLRQSGDITWIAIYRPLRNLEARGTTQDDGSRSYAFRHELHFGGTRVERPRGTVREQTERVTAVRIAGTPGFDEHELRDRLRLRAGDRFDFYRWQQDRERLERLYYERGFLEARISARRREADDPSAKAGVALEYDIDRGPRTTLTIDGYTLPNDAIESMKEAWGGAVFDGFLLDDLGMMARRQLLEEGYLQAEVQGKVAAGAGGDVKEIALHIVPGLRFDQRRISFTGHERLSAVALAAVVRARGLEATAWIQPQELKVALERQYQSLGHLGAAVTVDAPVFSGRSATLPVRIAEGRQFQVGSVSVLGTSAKSEADVRKAFDITTDSAYLPSRAERARRAVEVAYLRDGYNDIRVSVTTLVDRERGRADVTLNVDEGPQQVLSGIEVSGAEVTARTVINRALDLEPGQPANLTETYRAQKRLYDTGVFQTADIELRPVEGAATDPTQPVRALVTLEELPRYRFRYGFRVNDRMAPTEAGREVRPGLVADLLRRNLFGRVVSTGVAGQLEADRRLARGVVSVPQLFGLPVTTNFFLSGSREAYTPAASTPFVEDKSEITAEQRFRPANRMAVSYGYSFTRSHIFEPDPIPGLPVLELQTNVARLTGTFAWDTRDDPSNARSGWFQSSGLELGTASLGSDLRFIKYLAQQYYFKSAWRGLVLASAFRLGVGRGFDQDLIPSEKFFAGGGASVRGFAEDSLGERDFFGDPKGGNSLLVLNQELRVPIFKWVYGVSFIDAGNVFPRAKDMSAKDLEAGAGFGLRINSPFALVRIDYGMPLTRRSREPFGRWYFAIGQTF